MPKQVIAERRLQAAEDSAQTIDIRIYAPEHVPGGQEKRDEWQCAVEMAGLPPRNGYSDAPSWVVNAADSLDALLLAIVSIRGALDACHKELGLQFTWDLLKDGEGGHAIPRAITTWLGPDHERHLVEVMLNEDRAFIERKRHRAARLRDERRSDGLSG